LGQAPLVAVGGSAPAHHDLQDLGLDILVVGAHELLQESMGIIAGVLEASLLDSAVEFLPFEGEACRPFLAGFWFAMDFLRNGFPGAANGAHFGRGGEKGVHVVAHEVNSQRSADERGQKSEVRGQSGRSHSRRWNRMPWISAPFTGLAAKRSRPAVDGGWMGTDLALLAPFTGPLAVGLQPSQRRRLKSEHREAP
jgi:hypothetical protein